MNPAEPGSGAAAAAALARADLFRGLDPSALAEIAAAARIRRVERGRALFREGDRATTLYVLAEGRVKIVQSTPEGEQVVLRIAGPGATIALVAALEGAAYPASAEAVVDCRALGLDGRTLARLIERRPRLATNALRFVLEQLHEMQDRFREMATERVERRLARAVMRLAAQSGRREGGVVEIDFPVTREDLAQMAGTTLFSASRILRAWARRRILRTGRRRVAVLDPHGLAAIAEDLPTSRRK